MSMSSLPPTRYNRSSCPNISGATISTLNPPTLRLWQSMNLGMWPKKPNSNSRMVMPQSMLTVGTLRIIYGVEMALWQHKVALSTSPLVMALSKMMCYLASPISLTSLFPKMQTATLDTFSTTPSVLQLTVNLHQTIKTCSACSEAMEASSVHPMTLSLLQAREPIFCTQLTPTNTCSLQRPLLTLMLLSKTKLLSTFTTFGTTVLIST